MKTIKLLTLLLAVVTCLACSVSCKKNNTDTPGGGGGKSSELPDAIFKGQVKVNGSTAHDLNFTLPKQTAGQYAINGSYNGTVDLFQIICQEAGKWGFTIAGKTGGVKTGDYNVFEASTYYNAATQLEGFAPTSGTFKITKTHFHSQADNIKTWFVDGEVNMSLKDKKSNVATISGTFTGINIGEN